MSKTKKNGSVKVLPIILKSAVVLLALTAFAANVYYAALSGGEYLELKKKDRLKGSMQLVNVAYENVYFAGDPFSFDEKNTQIRLLVKDPNKEDIVKIDNLPADQYNFQVNGEGRIYTDPVFIQMKKGDTFVDIISVEYPSVKASIPVQVYDQLDPSTLSSTVLYEAEEADVYQNDKLLTQEEMRAAPYLSTYRDPVDGLDCSGGACLYNFQSNDMKVVFGIAASEEVQVDLKVKICQRTTAATFGSYYKFTLNGNTVEDVVNQTVPARPSGASNYFNPYTLETVTVKLKRGVNFFTFESGSKVGTASPVNLDAIELVASKDAITVFDSTPKTTQAE